MGKVGVWYPSGTGDGGLPSTKLSLSDVSLCPAMSVAEVDRWGDDWRSGEPTGEFGEVVEGLEVRLAEGFMDAPLLLSDGLSLGRAEPFSCTWTGVMMTVA